MRYYTIFSKKLRDFLIGNGFSEIKKPERNLKYPKYFVFFFEDTEDLHKYIDIYMEDR